MTIRYKCRECEAVLKIRDELAGNEAKCPKCKTSFRIPSQQAHVAPDGPAAKSKATNVESLEDLVDMPREVTPRIELREEFDPTEVLVAGSDSSAGLTTSNSEMPRPSVAELMMEHQEKRKAKQARTEARKQKGGLAEAAKVADAYTAGSATEALTRTYDQKRGKASEAPRLTREEQREAEYAAARKDYLIKAAPAIGGVLVVAYLIIAWAFSEAVPDLEYVAGVVTVNGAPMADIQVIFSPVESAAGKEASTSTGLTDAEGRYIMMFTYEHEGVVAGQHKISISSISGVEFNLPTETATLTVNPGEDHTFDFNL